MIFRRSNPKSYSQYQIHYEKFISDHCSENVINEDI